MNSECGSQIIEAIVGLRDASIVSMLLAN